MTSEQDVVARMEESFQANPWHGVISREEALAHALRYRQNLCAEERALYDEHIERGHHPSHVEEMIERMRSVGVLPVPQRIPAGV